MFQTPLKENEPLPPTLSYNVSSVPFIVYLMCLLPMSVFSGWAFPSILYTLPRKCLAEN